MLVPIPQDLKQNYYTQAYEWNGLYILGNQEVSKQAIKLAAEMLLNTLRHAPGLVAEMASHGVRFSIIPGLGFVGELPEFDDLDTRDGAGATLEFLASTARENNILRQILPDLSDGRDEIENLAVHEWAHAIHNTAIRQLSVSDPVAALFSQGQQIWQGTFAATNVDEYFAELFQSYFDANQDGGFNHNQINTRTDLLSFDPAAHDYLASQFGNDSWRPGTWFGGDSPDAIVGLETPDLLFGNGGNDILRGKEGDDQIDGGEGFDTASYSGNRADYEVRIGAEGYPQVIDSGAAPTEGTDTLTGIERLVFADRSYNLAIQVQSSTVDASTLNSIVDLYVAYFNRVPEAGGLGYWIDQYVAGKSLVSIAAEFYAAGIQFSETTGYTADMPLSDFVKVLYANVLGRSGSSAPPQADIDYWLDQVGTGAVTREGMVARFLNDARLFYDDPDVGWVPRLLDQKVEFGKLHAVTYGLDYNDQQASIETTVALAAAVTPTGFADAVAMVGLSADDYLV